MQRVLNSYIFCQLGCQVDEVGLNLPHFNSGFAATASFNSGVSN
uniref:Uncharacterized protein n=1 Tax=Anguilla anguilla TaxID=7936 RepID=A0A0E9SXU0_ANGAN